MLVQALLARKAAVDAAEDARVANAVEEMVSYVIKELNNFVDRPGSVWPMLCYHAQLQATGLRVCQRLRDHDPLFADGGVLQFIPGLNAAIQIDLSKAEQ